MSKVNNNRNMVHNLENTMEKLLKKAEVARLTKTLKYKLASASLETKKTSPFKTPDKTSMRRKLRGDGPRSASKRAFTPTYNSVIPEAGYATMPNLKSSIHSKQFARTDNEFSPTKHEDYDSGSIPELKFPDQHQNQSQDQDQAYPLSHADEGHEIDLPAEPSTPVAPKRQVPKTPEAKGRDPGESGADLLLHFAKSPGRTSAPNTPDFNMNEYLNLYSPSPRVTKQGSRRALWPGVGTDLFSQPEF